VLSARATNNTDTGLMTRQGFERLQQELQQLTGDERQRVADRLREARLDGGDPAENGELMDALDERERLEQRIGEIEARLAGARIAQPGQAGGVARIGTRIRLTNESTGIVEFTLVGVGEADLARGRFSIASPMGQAVAGRRSGDTIEVQTPRRRVRFQVVSVRAERVRDAGRQRRAA
jgi:transcription elongation factor GreA